MPTLVDLKSAVNGLLNLPTIGSLLKLNSYSREHAFEAYVFALVVKAVRQAGGSSELYGIKSGANPNPAIFRGAPGYMGSTAQDFCFARCTLGEKKFEIHIDVIYVGSSGAMHEVDVSICDLSAANMVRKVPKVQPGTRGLRAAFECKCYDSNLGTALGRSFVGLVSDCGTLKVKSFLTNGKSQGLARYFSKSKGPQVYFRVSPLATTDAERFVLNVEQILRQWASIN